MNVMGRGNDHDVSIAALILVWSPAGWLSFTATPERNTVAWSETNCV